MMIQVESAGNTTLWIDHTPYGITKYKIEIISEADLVSIQTADSLVLNEKILVAGGQVAYALATDSDADVVQQFIEDTKQ